MNNLLVRLTGWHPSRPSNALVGVRVTVLIGGLIATATGAILLIPGVTDPDKALTHSVPAASKATGMAPEPVP